MPVRTNEWQKHNPWEPSPLSHPEPVPLVKSADLFNPMLTIADVMKHEAPTCSPGASLPDVVRILRGTASEAVFVVSDGRPVGVLTDRRIALAVLEHGENLTRLCAQDLMAHAVRTVRADARLGALLESFADEGVAVVDNEGRIHGVVRWVELMGHLSERAMGKLVISLFSPERER